MPDDQSRSFGRKQDAAHYNLAYYAWQTFAQESPHGGTCSAYGMVEELGLG